MAALTLACAGPSRAPSAATAPASETAVPAGQPGAAQPETPAPSSQPADAPAGPESPAADPPASGAAETPACSADVPCPAGLLCARVGDTDRPASCVRYEDACAALGCAPGSCILLKSLPAIIRCKAP
jgi:hypothetical protein